MQDRKPLRITPLGLWNYAMFEILKRNPTAEIILYDDLDSSVQKKWSLVCAHVNPLNRVHDLLKDCCSPEAFVERVLLLE